MLRWLLPLLLVLTIGVAVLAQFVLVDPDAGGGRAERAGRAAEPPPSVEDLEALFLSDPEGFERMKDLLLSLPRQNMSIQADYLSWPEHRGWSRDGKDRWWTGDAMGGIGLWQDAEAVYEEAGITAEQHERLSAFLQKHGFLVAHRVPQLRGGGIQFKPALGHDHFAVGREIVWHEGDQPFEEDAVFLRSETDRVPQRTTEQALPATGWWIRTTTRG